MIKKIALFLSLVLLVSCGGGEASNANLALYENDDFSVMIPTSWKMLDPTVELPNTIGAGEIVLAARAEVVQGIVANSINILSQPIGDDISAVAFAQSNMIQSSKEYIDFQKFLSRRDVFADGQEGLFSVFETRYNKNQPLIKFIQTAHVCGNTVYMATIGIDPSIIEYDRYIGLLQTFSCK